jgi:nucleoside-diphosphate kinase
MSERTLILVKPDGVQRRLVGEIIGRFERKGLRLVGLKLMHLSEEKAKEHYAEHTDKPFFGELVQFITSSPLVAMAWEGPGAIQHCRNLMGATRPGEATPGSIRGDFAVETGMNIVHGSDGPESAVRELGIFFSEAELIDFKGADQSWIG